MNNKIRITSATVFVLIFLIIIGQYISSYISQVSAVILTGYSMLCITISRKKGVFSKSLFGKYLLVLDIIIIVGMINSYIKFGEDLFFNLRRVLVIIASSLFYFACYELIQKGKISYLELKKIIYALGTVSLILFILQYIIYGYITFFPEVHVGIRAGYSRYRFYYNCIVLALPIVLAFDEIIKKKKSITRICLSILFIFLSIFEIYYIQSYRLSSLAILLTLLIGYFIYSKSYKKMIVFIVFLIASYVFIHTSKEFNSMWESFLNGTDTFWSRARASAYYFERLKEHWLMGYGTVFPSDSYLSKAAIEAGYSAKMNLGDNGIIGFAYCYGLLGFVWFVLFWARIFKYGIKILNQNKGHRLYGILFPLYTIIVVRNEILWYWNNGLIIFVLFLILIDSEIKDINEEKKQGKLFKRIKFR